MSSYDYGDLHSFRIPNPQVRDAADQHCEAALLLFQQPPGAGVLLPMLTVAAFSIELYLKSLNAEDVYHAAGDGIYIVTAKSVTGGHHLVDLFCSIDSEVRDAMNDAFRQTELSGTYPSLGNILQKYNNLFVDTRYIFEQPNSLQNLTLDHLTDLLEFMREFVRGLPPTRRLLQP